MLNINQAAKYLNVCPLTLRNWEKAGLVKPVRTNGGHRRYTEADLSKLIGREKILLEKETICYCRVSSSGQRNDLDRQIEAVSQFCAARGYSFRVISDIGSGLNYTKPGFCELIRMINNKDVSRIIVNYKDRLIRFGIEIIEQLCSMNDVEIIVVNKSESKSYESELVEDVLSVVTVFSSRLYGSRSHKTKKIIENNKKEFNANEAEEQESI